jgi:[ribosomal protein S5]-alanine N-acetyltransferase
MTIKKRIILACGIAALTCFFFVCNAEKSQTILETERLYYRPFAEADLEQLYQLYSDKEVMEHIPMEKAMGKKIDKTAIKEMLDFYIRHQQEYGYSHWAAFEKETDEFVGRIGIHKEKKPSTVMAGYIIRKEFWGKGYATESMRAIIDWAFSNTDVSKIIGATVPEHRASIRVMEKVGMQFVQEYQEYGCIFVQYAIERQQVGWWEKFKNWVKGKIFMKKFNVFLNHINAVIDEKTYDEIVKSEFLKNEFCKSKEKTNADKDRSWTGFYMTGENTYIELFNNKNKKSLREMKIAHIGVGFSVDTKDEFEKVLTILKQKFANNISHGLLEKNINGKLIPWFYHIEFKDDISEMLHMDTLDAWIMAYHKDYLKFKNIGAFDKESVTRKEYNSDLFDKTKLFKDIEEITFLMSDKIKRKFIERQILLGYTYKEAEECTICCGPGITFKLKSSSNQICKLLQLYMSLNREIKDFKTYHIGNSTIELKNKTAIWTFK